MQQKLHTEYTTRQLTSADWQLFRALRLEALRTESAMFSSTYARESQFGDGVWQQRLQNPDAAFYVLLAGSEPIGITGIMLDTDDNTKANLVASYIKEPFRGRGLSSLLYEARIDWAKQKGCKQIIVSHRDINVASRAANQRYGFRLTHSEPMQWPDGTEATIQYYILDL